MCYGCNGCDRCGKMTRMRKLLDRRLCLKCGTEVDRIVTICPYCGANLPPLAAKAGQPNIKQS